MDRLGEIEQRLLAENLRFEESKKNDAEMYACGYAHGVEDALGAVAAAEQQAQPAPEMRTNLDRIHDMSAEEIAEWVCRNMKCDICPLGNELKVLCDDDGFTCCQVFARWLNSPAADACHAKEDNKK